MANFGVQSTILSSSQLNTAFITRYEYSHISGVPDGVTDIVLSGSGSVTEAATDSAIAFATGAGVGSNCASYSTLDGLVLSSRRMVFRCDVSSIDIGTGGTNRIIFCGFAQDSAPTSATDGAFFENNNGTWRAVTISSSTRTQTTITVTDFDILSLDITTSSARFFVNGVLVATHTSNLPGAATNLFTVVAAYSTSPTTEVYFEISQLYFSQYFV